MEMVEQGSFLVAAFAIDGRLEGVNHCAIDSMSPKWLKLCSEYLDHHGNNFNAPWAGGLAHLSTKFTADQGVALVSFSSNDKLLASILLASGKSGDAELSVMKLFINSLISVDSVRLGATTDEPFREMLSMVDRPLMVVIPWGNESVDDQENSLVRELSVHLAAAYFLRVK